MSAKRKVFIGLFVLLALGVLALGVALYTESIGVRSPESGDTISELAYELWAHQPWVVLLGSNLLAFPCGFFAGHWFAAPKSRYDQIRLAAMTRAQLEDELRKRNLAR